MLKIATLKIEGLASGCITDRRPNISFSLESNRPGEALESAIISVGDWRLETRDQIVNRYYGELRPFTRYDVRVAAIGTSGEEARATSSFETGRLDTPWKGEWITDGGYEFPDKESPVPMTFRREFAIERKVRRALVNATALGIYELSLNGKKVGEDYFAPGFTSYAHQIQYQTYDVTSEIAAGNELVAIVGGGWAVGAFNVRRKSKISADRQAFLCELRLEYEDGSVELICSDDSWEVSEAGNYRFADWYDGETYDARIDRNSIQWKKATIAALRGSPALIAQYGPAVRAKDMLKPVSQTRAPSGELIYDFGQNFAGVISARIRGRNGQQVAFRHAEVLVDGELYVKSLRTAKATATYICAEGEQDYSPRLTYMGFRYVGVSGIDPSAIELSARALYSDIDETGYFECSNELVNKLNRNILWGGKSNFVDIPTDCPQRDERMGWTGDLAVFASTACFNFDLGRFLDKWLMDMRSEQGPGGGLPMVVPKQGDSWPTMATSCWGDGCITIPWDEYLARGDKELLARQYPCMKRFLKAVQWWAGFLSFTPSRRYIWRFPFHWGDWCAPEGRAREWVAKTKWVATAYFANSCSLVAKIAELIGESDDAAHYRELRAKVVYAYRRILTDGQGRIKKEFQTAYVLPLRFGMTEGEETKAMAKNLARLVREAGKHLGTGFPGTPHLLFALSDNGYADLAYDLLLQESCPSWLYEVKAGGTTIWERWDALRPDGTVNIAQLNGDESDEASGGGMVSFNHYAMGAVGDWLYKRIAGIEPTSGGYKTFRVAPMPGGGLSWARGSVLTPFGRVASSWKIEGDRFSIEVEVPVSTLCTLVLPSGETQVLSSGRHAAACPIAMTR